MKENWISFGVSVIGTIGSMFLGGWDISLRILVFCMIADYVTGVLGAIRTRTLNSEIMFWGGIRKAIIFVVIALAVMLDEYVGDHSPIFRTMAIYFYVGREGISIVENLGVLNVPLPSFVKKILEQLQEKGDGSNGNYPNGQ